MKHILLVEDDPFLVDIYATKLKEQGFSCEAVEDGEQVLKKIAEKPPALLLLDIVLPHINGWQILTKIRQDPKIKKIPIIILSNLSQQAEVEKGLKLGATKYLIKAHFTPKEVVKEIKKILK